MASYLKPRRGTASTASSKLTGSDVLKNGEIFFELNASGAGKGVGKIKMGDGSTDYSSLQYFLSLQESPITFDASGVTDQIGSLVSGVSIPTAFKCIKSSLVYLKKQVTNLNNDLSSVNSKLINKIKIENITLASSVSFSSGTFKTYDIPSSKYEGYTGYLIKPIVDGGWADTYACVIAGKTSTKFGIRNIGTDTFSWNVSCTVIFIAN